MAQRGRLDSSTWKEKTSKNQLTRGSLANELSQVAIDGVESTGLLVI